MIAKRSKFLNQKVDFWRAVSHLKCGECAVSSSGGENYPISGVRWIKIIWKMFLGVFLDVQGDEEVSTIKTSYCLRANTEISTCLQPRNLTKILVRVAFVAH